MDPLVFNIITSDSESTSSSAMKSHPGDCAAPLDILEWLDKFDEKIESTSYGQVRNRGPYRKRSAAGGSRARIIWILCIMRSIQLAPSRILYYTY